MIVRKCSQGHNIRLHRNSTPGASRTKKYRDGTTETLTYPSAKNYFVVVDSEISKQTDSFKVAEEFYHTECGKKHSNRHGRLVIGKTKLINCVATVKEDYPSSDDTKDTIKSFLDLRSVEYSTKDTKDKLLDMVGAL